MPRGWLTGESQARLLTGRSCRSEPTTFPLRHDKEGKEHPLWPCVELAEGIAESLDCALPQMHEPELSQEISERTRVCALPAIAFVVNRPLGKGMWVPCRFSLKSGAAFWLAALSKRRVEAEALVEEFSIVCCALRPPLDSLFPYLPVVLSDLQRKENWLRRAVARGRGAEVRTPYSACEFLQWRMVPGEISFSSPTGKGQHWPNV